MEQIRGRTPRIYALDALRAIMMLLGLVIHSSITYGEIDYGNAWRIKDPNTTSFLNDYIVLIIHNFRMPVFFVVAGFFGALLFYEKQPLIMIKNRIARIVLPFVVFLFLLWPVINFAYTFSHFQFEGHSNSLAVAFTQFSGIQDFIPQKTTHLWFLYYLILTTFATVPLALLFKQTLAITSILKGLFEWVFKRYFLRIFIFASITFTLLYTSGRFWISGSNELTPVFHIFLFYFSFYLSGWLLYKSQHLLLSMMHHDLTLVMIGTVGYSINLVMYEIWPLEIVTAINSITVWLFIFGISGLFLRYGNKHSSTMRYISDASYWVYLVHLPLTAFIPGLIVEFPLPAMMKFLIVLTITTSICFLSYHFFVRNTLIGVFLNGRKYPKTFKQRKFTTSSD